jgi:hypothetical protein
MSDDLPQACAAPTAEQIAAWVTEAHAKHTNPHDQMRYVMQASGGRLNPRTVPAALQPAEHPPEVADAPRELDR